MKEPIKTVSEARVAPSSFREEEIREFVAFLEQRAGLSFYSNSVAETEKKLAGIVQELRLPCGQKLLDSVRGSKEVLQQIVNRFTVGESYFFRNRPHFEALRREILPDIAGENCRWRSLRIWCAGCARGEEPYSLSIMLAEHFPELLQWNVSITATDINTNFLEQARKGVYTAWSLRGVEPVLLEKYFARADDNAYRLSETVRKTVDFKHSNLRDFLDGSGTSNAAFDLVLCRNVLIYFTVDRALEIIASLARSLRIGGYLLLGHSETVPVPIELETVHFDATYAYRRVSEQQVASIRPRRKSSSSMLPIPGTGAVSMLPPARRSVLAIPGTGAEPTLPPRSFGLSRLGGVTPAAELSGRAGSRRAGARRRKKSTPTQVDNSYEIAIERAREHADRGEIVEAHEQLQKLVGTGNVLDHRVYFLHAIVSDQRGRPRETIESLKKAIFLHKGFVLGHYYLGVILEREGDAGTAERYLRNARNLLLKLPEEGLLEEAEGLTSGRLLEIVEARLQEVRLR